MRIASEACVVGVGTSAFARDTGLTTTQMIAQALRAALEDAGLRHADVDGLFVNAGGDFDKMAELLGLRIGHANQFWTHGRMCAPTLQQAALNVVAGFADVIACVYAIDITERGGGFGGGRSHGHEEYREGGGAHGEMAHYGLTHPGSGAAMAWRRYCHLYGAHPEALAKVAVTTRAHARLNPQAVMRGPMTTDDYFNARWVVDPLRLFDCAVVNDGAVCVLVTRADRARDLRQKPVYLAGMQGLHAGRDEFVFAPPGLGIWQQPDAPGPRSDRRAFEMAGVGPEDIDGFYCLDSFSPLVVFALEEFGFCMPGEGAAWIEAGHGALGGKMPINTNGGHLSEGMLGGWAHQVEAVRQLRGQCGERQIADAKIVQFVMGQGVANIYSNEPLRSMK